MSLTLIVTSISGFGLVALMTNNSKSETRTQRRTEINRALDFISDEVRMASRVNRTASLIYNGSTVPLSAVVTGSGLNLAELGSYGSIVLYLQIPIKGPIPASCPGGSPTPSDYDRVIYDIRPDTDTTDSWLGPQIIKRYGRTPEIDGTIKPCSPPASQTFIDSISDINIDPTDCTTSPAIVSGTKGFYACVNDREVNLYLRSKVANKQFPAEPPENVRSKAFSRITPPP